MKSKTIHKSLPRYFELGDIFCPSSDYRNLVLLSNIIIFRSKCMIRLDDVYGINQRKYLRFSLMCLSGYGPCRPMILVYLLITDRLSPDR